MPERNFISYLSRVNEIKADWELIPDYNPLNSVACIVYDLPKNAVRHLAKVLWYMKSEYAPAWTAAPGFCPRCEANGEAPARAYLDWMIASTGSNGCLTSMTGSTMPGQKY